MAHAYDYEIDLSRTDLAPAAIYRLVGTDRRVLDVGGANGNLARLLTAAGNEVTVVDLDPDWVAAAAVGTHRAVVVDLESTPLSTVFPTERFDVVVLADVLEHLRRPESVLAGVADVLAPSGDVIVSLPNVAHADIRLALLEGRWEYADSGLMDRTHLRWFTLAGLLQLVGAADFHIVHLERIRRPIGRTALGIGAHSPELIRALEAHAESDTYQFVAVLRRGPAPAGLPSVATPEPFSTTVLETAEAARRAALSAELAQARAQCEELQRLYANAVEQAAVLQRVAHDRVWYRRLRRIPRRLQTEWKRRRT